MARAKKKARKKAESQKEQSARFISAAIEAGMDNDAAKKFDRAFKKIVPKKSAKARKHTRA
jgi:hypothetical protein